jgi:hypothetical protein
MKTFQNCIASCIFYSRTILLILQSVNWSLLALRIYVHSLNAVDTTRFFVKKTYLALNTAFTDEQYIFYRNDPVPYSLGKVVASGPAMPEPEWIYNLTRTRFTAPDSSMKPLKLPWLSAVIKYNDMKLYSLDSYIDTVTFSNYSRIPPNPEIIIAAWSLTTGIILDKNLEMKLLVITNEGNEEVFHLHSKPLFIEDLDEIQLLSDIEDVSPKENSRKENR